ncbi:hypothetical protein Syun_010043 [Stephania yunnanensis]|uniref:Uncharacterized protein n=1 Tax=Stephania yunnanensis TaxID=152371 RepID=A0AAP0PRA2_9MAGN
MAIVLCNKTIIKPLPSSSNLNASPQLVPLTIFDKAAFDLHINVLYAFRPPLPSNEVLKNALSEVLVYFPHLAGRFKTDDKGRSCIVLDNAGIRVIDAYLPISLSEQLPFDPSEEHNHLLASVEGVHKRFLLQIQLNRHACSGLVIGMPRKATQARDLKVEEWTQIRVAVNGRARMKPPVPMEYFGNLVLWAYPRLRVKEVLRESHACIAKAIHDAVARLDHRYFQSFIDFGSSDVMTNGDEDREEMEAKASKFGNILCPDLEVDSWLKFQFHERDFGGGGPCAIFLPIIPLEGLLVFLPSCSDHGGVDVLISLLPQHAQIYVPTDNVFVGATQRYNSAYQTHKLYKGTQGNDNIQSYLNKIHNDKEFNQLSN